MRGQLGQAVVASFAGFAAEVEPAETVLRGQVGSQEDLRALLERIEAFGLELIEVRRLDPPDEPRRSRA